MGVHDAADGGEGEKQPSMCGRIGGGTQVALDLVALEIDEHHLLGSEFIVVYPGWLDGENSTITIDGGSIAES